MGKLQEGYNWLKNEMGGRLANIKDSIAVEALKSVLLKEFSVNLKLDFKRNIEKGSGFKSGGELTLGIGGNFSRTYFDAQLECVKFDWGFFPPRLTYVAIGKKLSGEKWNLTLPEVDIDWNGTFGIDVKQFNKEPSNKPSRLLTIQLYKLFRLAKGVVPLYPYLDAKFIVAPGLYTITNFLSPKIKLNIAFKLMGDKKITYEEYYRILNVRNISTAATGVIRNLISVRYKNCKEFDQVVLKSSNYLNKLFDQGGGSGSCEEVDKAVGQEPSGIYFNGKGSLDFEKLFGFGMGLVLLLGKGFGSSGLWVGGDAFLGVGLAIQAGFGGDTSGSFTTKGIKFDKMELSAYTRSGFNISLFGGVIFFCMLFNQTILKAHKSWLLHDFLTLAVEVEATTGGVKKEINSIENPREAKEVEAWVREKSKEAALKMLTDDEFILLLKR
jgi:hypothetical protein